MDPIYKRAERTIDLVKEVIPGRDFYIFGSFARRKFHKEAKFDIASDLDVLLNTEDFQSAVTMFGITGKFDSFFSSILVPNHGIFSAYAPSERRLNSEHLISTIYTPIHLVELPQVQEVIFWMNPSEETLRVDEGVKYLVLPEKMISKVSTF